ncbi:MAG TPA: DEAD/DEAH box helicase [Pirellulaceae bacterium]|nr:DEAD/DEAH box helicase [Pirellulaceae bacterium]
MNDQSVRDEVAQRYFDQLPFSPYPVQEEALFAWFSSPQGVLVCAPTGTGKTLIAEAAMFEALQLGRKAYYTTPLIALTDQKFQELQAAATRWGYPADSIGLATGTRKINPEAPIQVVVAEILLNRLLHREAFDFSDVWAVVMDEFHSFNDLERGVVWEFGLALLPTSVKTLLLSATVGNAREFNQWLALQHRRQLQLVESQERRVPLTYQWVADQMLDEQLELMFGRNEADRLTPALVFCFNRETCWTVANLLRGKKLIQPDQQQRLFEALENHELSQGAGPKLKQILVRGIGVHHAGVLPKYRRLVEQLFQDRLLSICVCTETLAAGVNLPARSVVLPSLVKGPSDKLKLIEASAAQQMFGRAGRPQFDSRGFVFALAHEDDVRIARWQEKMDRIPEDTKDPGLLRARKDLKRKMPRRRSDFTYWNESQFQQLVQGKPADLESRGPLTWRLLAYLLDASADVQQIRQLVAKRLLKGRAALHAEQHLVRMLRVLHRAGYVKLSPPPPSADATLTEPTSPNSRPDPPRNEREAPDPPATLDLGQRARRSNPPGLLQSIVDRRNPAPPASTSQPSAPLDYIPELAEPTERLPLLLGFRGVHPLFGLYLVDQLGVADTHERIQAFESLLKIPGSVGPAIDLPSAEELPDGPLATERLNPQLLTLGLATAEELAGPAPDEDRREWWARHPDLPPRPLPLAYKLQRLFQYEYPGVDDLRVWPVWVAGELLQFGGDFNLYITCKKLQTQEGIIFRHLLRLVMVLNEMSRVAPAEVDGNIWRDELGELADKLEQTCRRVDPLSTDQWLAEEMAS